MSGINRDDFCSHEALFLLSRVTLCFLLYDVLGLLHEFNVVDLPGNTGKAAWHASALLTETEERATTWVQPAVNGVPGADEG